MAAREEPRERAPARAEKRSVDKGPAAAKHKAHAAAVGHAIAEAGRHLHLISVAEAHERVHKAPEPRRLETRAAHAAPAAKARPVHAVPVRAVEHPVRHNAEQQRKPRHVAG
jgi:hypothetical protein